MYRLSTDVGGTFTDGVLLNETTGKIKVSKVSSTPNNPAIAVIQNIEKFDISLSDVSFLAHGTTVVINALIEGRGAKTALINTRGFRDVLEIGRSNRTEMYDALYKKPTPLIPRHLRIEVNERIGPDGNILLHLIEEDISEIVEYFQEKKIEAIAVCLLNAYANPEHEQAIGRFLAKHYPEAAVSLSHQITRRYYEYERTSTVAQNAYVMPVVKGYLNSLEEQLSTRQFKNVLQVMQSNGGLMESSVAQEIPIAMVESGPVGGTIGAAQLANMAGYENAIAYDMGGTTAKTSVIAGGLPETADQYMVEGRPILLPVIDVREIGAGGGSIAWIDEAGAMHVGPRSAGAEPGPACYMRGGHDPTVTDAHLQLGILNPNYFLGGEMEISPDLGRKAIQEVADRIGLSVDEAALGIIKIVNTNMSGLLQSMTVKRGYDPREFAMVAFGGAGPIHATAIAKELYIPTVIVPPFPGVFSAWGILMADLRHDFGQTYIAPMDSVNVGEINKLFRTLEERVKEFFAREHIPEKSIVISYQLDLRYTGQEHTLSISAPSPLREEHKSVLSECFDNHHLRVYGHNAPDEPKEIVTLKLIGIGKVIKPVLEIIGKGEGAPLSEACLGERKVYVGNGEYRPFTIYRRDKLLSGNILRGPAIVEEVTATAVLEENQTCWVDQYGNLIISLN
jgi:N-methylhydantoinase A